MRPNDEQLAALREVAACKLRMWDACRRAELLLDPDGEMELDTGDFDVLCASVDTAEQVNLITAEDFMETLWGEKG